MDTLFTLTPPPVLALCLIVALVAGIIKGMVGFAMPMIIISGLGSLLAPELALAGLILPTLASNGLQAFRQGVGAAVESARRFRVFLGVGAVMLLLSAQLVSVMPAQVMFALIGVPIVLFAAAQLLGWSGQLPGGGGRRVEVAIAAFAGFIGGVSGVWGPPTVAYLTMIGTEKTEQMRVQGVIYGLGAVLLTLAHIGSGVLNAATVWLSLALVPAAILGMWIGGQVQDRIDQHAFRRATQLVLLVAGLNLVRRAFFA
ncbi:sulfite exporter TauE/SafE family protein [Roseivivax isoporae]|uniref:Probable membrane transporter protein n=1 Tax=Roseivivax isoporae LMG 25204 TaxID=1449351 RepID=X7FDJ2_9RHOB|nr:sulfite exporter TauE/SafE family protein [Roseivivax isoporae]ETX30880.1 membrane protein [Roseivivax isoporae LMG 25204]